LEFSNTIQRINLYFAKAEAVDWTTFAEGCLGCLTYYSIFFCYDDKYKKTILEFQGFLREQNERIYKPRGIEWLNPMDNGLLHIDIVVDAQ